MEGFITENLTPIISLATTLVAIIGGFYNIKMEIRSIIERIAGIEDDRKERWCRQDTLNDTQSKAFASMASDIAVIRAQIEMYFQNHLNNKK